MSRTNSSKGGVFRPKTETMTLRNGIQVTIVPVPHSPVVDVRFVFETGFRDVSVETYHLPHVLEHILMEDRIDGESLADRLFPYGVDVNATTDYGEMVMLAQSPVQHAEKVVEQMSRTVQNLTVTETLVEREKTVIRREIAEQFDGLALTVMHYFRSKNMPSIIPEDAASNERAVEGLDVADVTEYVEQYFTSCGLHVIIVGDVGETELRVAERILGKMPQRKVFRGTAHVPFEREFMSEQLPVLQGGSLAILRFCSSVAGEPPDLQRHDGVAENYMIARYFNGPQAEALKGLRDSGLVYNLDIDGDRVGDLVERSLIFTTDGAKGRTALLGVLDVLFETLRIVDDDMFQRTKQYIQNTSTVAHESVSAIAAWYQADIAAARPLWHLADDTSAFSALKPEDVQQAVFKMLSRGTWQVGLASKDNETPFFGYLRELYDACSGAASPQECYQSYASWKAKVGKLPQPVADEEAHETLRNVMTFGALASSALFFLVYLPTDNPGQLVSMFDIAKQHPAWGMLMLYALLTLLYLPRTSFTGIYRPLIVASGALAGISGYLFMFVRYVSDVGTDSAPFLEDVASVYHPLFFVVFCGLTLGVAVISAYQQWRKQK